MRQPYRARPTTYSLLPIPYTLTLQRRLSMPGPEEYPDPRRRAVARLDPAASTSAPPASLRTWSAAPARDGARAERVAAGRLDPDAPTARYDPDLLRARFQGREPRAAHHLQSPVALPAPATHSACPQCSAISEFGFSPRRGAVSDYQQQELHAGETDATCPTRPEEGISTRPEEGKSDDGFTDQDSAPFASPYPAETGAPPRRLQTRAASGTGAAGDAASATHRRDGVHGAGHGSVQSRLQDKARGRSAWSGRQLSSRSSGSDDEALSHGNRIGEWQPASDPFG